MMAKNIWVLESASPFETRELGKWFAGRFAPGDVVGLIGPLGAGKTEFVRGCVPALRSCAPVRSPTFSLVNLYETPRFPVYHFDFYRLGSADELIDIGMEEFTRGDGVVLIEWADLFPDVLPDHTLLIRFTDTGETGRRIEWECDEESPFSLLDNTKG